MADQGTLMAIGAVDASGGLHPADDVTPAAATGGDPATREDARDRPRRRQAAPEKVSSEPVEETDQRPHRINRFA